jgi:two-component system, NarL family, response regulator
MTIRRVNHPVRVALVDESPAMREGLAAIIAAERDLLVVGVAASEWQLRPVLVRARPDVVVLGLQRRSLAMCFEIRRRPHPPAVVLYSPVIDDELMIAAALAGAGAVIDASSAPADLLDALREVARTPGARPRISLRSCRDVAARLDPSDHAILAMRLAGDQPAKIAHTLGLKPAAVIGRIAKMIARLDPARGVA